MPAPTNARRLAGPLLAAWIGAFAATPAWAGGTNSATTQTPTLSFEQSAVDRPVEAGTLKPITPGVGPGDVLYAFASGDTLTLRSAVAASDHDYLYHSATAATQWTFSVDAGSSGLAVGAPITVMMDLRLDGHLVAGALSTFGPPGPTVLASTFNFGSAATAFLGLQLIDLDSPDYEPGAWIAQISLGATASAASAWYAAQGGNPETAYTVKEHSASAFARDRNGYWQWTGPADHQQSGNPSAPQERFDLDTGVITLAFDTFVGNRIFVDAGLTTSVTCNASTDGGIAPACAGQADFAHTFDGELRADVDGITFGGVTPGVASAVPEPASPLLALAGLAVLVAWRRRPSRRA